MGVHLKKAVKNIKKARREIYKANKSTRVSNRAILYLKRAESELPFHPDLHEEHVRKCRELDEKFGVE
ncbi:MAG: hypothetical protein ACOC8Y_05865 [Candidatus Natronoplasma sp.]